MPAPQVEWESDGRTAGTGKSQGQPPDLRQYQPPSYSQMRETPGPQAPGQGIPQPVAPAPTQQYPQQYPPSYGAQGQQMPSQQYPLQYPPQYGAQGQPIPGQQYPPQYPPSYGAQGQQMPSQQYPLQYPPQYGAQGQPMPGQQYPPQYPPQYGYGAPGRPIQPMKAPGTVLMIIGMVFALGGMVSVMIGNVIFRTSAPVPCLIITFIFGIIGTALGAAAWAQGNKGAKGVVALGVMEILMAIVIGLIWASAFS